METSESLLVDSLLQFEYQKDHHFQPKFANQSLHTCRRPLERTSDRSFHLLSIFYSWILLLGLLLHAWHSSSSFQYSLSHSKENIATTEFCKKLGKQRCNVLFEIIDNFLNNSLLAFVIFNCGVLQVRMRIRSLLFSFRLALWVINESKFEGPRDLFSLFLLSLYLFPFFVLSLFMSLLLSIWSTKSSFLFLCLFLSLRCKDWLWFLFRWIGSLDRTKRLLRSGWS